MTLLPQIELTSERPIAPEMLLDAAVRDYRARVVKEGVLRVLAGPLEFGGGFLSGVLKEVMAGNLHPYRIMAGAAIRHLILDSRERNGIFIQETDAAQVADEAALNLVTYVASTSGDAVLDGYHRMVNMGIPPKEAARRAISAFGLTKPQMRTMIALKPDQGVKSSVPGSLKKKSDAYIRRAFQQRVRTLNQNTVRQVEHDAVQSGWEEEVRTGTLQDTTLKVWLTAADERTCPICAPMDRHAVGVMDTFRLPDGNRVKNPPVHVNCRCSTQLVRDYRDVERFSKAWDPKKHPRQSNGEFGRKEVAFKDPGRQINLTDLSMEQLSEVSGLTDLGGPQLSIPSQLTNFTSLTNFTPLTSLTPLTPTSLSNLTSTATTPSSLTNYQLDGLVSPSGKTYSLTNLSLVAAAATAHPDLAPREAPISGPVRSLGTEYVSLALPSDFERTDLSDSSGALYLDGLRFVKRGNYPALRNLVNEKMSAPRGADTWLDEHEHDMAAELDELRSSKDPNITQLHKSLVHQLVGKNVYGAPVLDISADRAKEAWREVLSRPSSEVERRQVGWKDGQYSVAVFDGNGHQIAEELVPAHVYAALTNISPEAEFMPRVFAARNAWDSKAAGTEGDTEQVVAGSDEELNVGGPFVWKKGLRGVFWLTPDVDLQPRMARGRTGEG
jgi:hypothetical protein